MNTTDFLKFYATAQKLKLTVRHAWLGIEHRQESVADHTWGLCLLASVLMPQINSKVNPEKVFKMLIYHDLAEAITGDIPAGIKQYMDRAEIQKAERKALEEVIRQLPKEQQEEILANWEEFEECETLEAKFCTALDKFEAIMQHDLSDLETWEDSEYALNVDYRDDKFDFDPVLRELKDYLNAYNYWLTEQAGKLEQLNEKQRDFWQASKSKYKFELIDYK